VKQRALLGRRIAVIGNSEWNTRRATQSGFFEPTTRFETIYYPLDTEAFQPRPKPACRTALGLQLDHTVIGFACDDLGDPRKGFDTLVGALKSLPAELATRISLLSFGRDPSAALKSSIAVPWTHLGYINSNAAKIAAYSAMDLFVVPSHAEAFGQTAIEALACGTAVIASNVGGLREAVDQGRCGHLVEPGDSPALTQAIVDLAQRPDARAALADAGRALVVSRHAPSACARAYETVYSELLRESFVTS
jgi:glycosyltransferase involved in cell wall biosynthesis